jgi:hypothetical protein
MDVLGHPELGDSNERADMQVDNKDPLKSLWQSTSCAGQYSSHNDM